MSEKLNITDMNLADYNRCNKCGMLYPIQFRHTCAHIHSKVYNCGLALVHPPHREWICTECGVQGIEPVDDTDGKEYREAKEQFAFKAMEALKPCPICGNKNAQMMSQDEIEGKPVGGFYTVCCRMNTGGCGATSGYREKKQDAIDAWNRRATT